MEDGKQRFVVVWSDQAEGIDPKQISGFLYNGEACNLLIDTETKEIVGADGGEPEDQTLGRDWSWVPELLNIICAEEREKARDAYERGRLTGLEEAHRTCDEYRAACASSIPDDPDLCQEAYGSGRELGSKECADEIQVLIKKATDGN